MPAPSQYDDDDVFESLGRRGWEIDPNDRDQAKALGAEHPHLESAADETDPRQWYPGADRRLRMPTQGRYPGGFPVGAVVHFTAGRCDRGDADAEATIRYGASQSHGYFCISRTGKVYQTGPVSAWGYHAGKSYYAGVGNYVHSRLAGIEVCNAGQVTKTARGYEPWWNRPGDTKNTYYGEEQVRLVEPKDNVRARGHFHRYTPEQERSLIDLVLWMHSIEPTKFQLKYVVGHDEVSPGRKDDPGGSLSMLMPSFRAHLAEELARRAAPPPATPTSPPPPTS